MNSTTSGTKQLSIGGGHQHNNGVDNSNEVTKRNTVRSIKPASFAAQPKSNILKTTNIKGILTA